jgi:uncharacterized protein YegL
MENPYSARITTKTPSAFVFLLDLSGSMEEKVSFNGKTTTKSAAVAQIINGLIAELIGHCKRESGYRDYFDIAVIGYGGEQVRSLLPVGASHPIFRKSGELAHAKVDIVKTFRERTLPDGGRAISCISGKEWVKPSAVGKTPMGSAFQETYRLLYDWTRRHASARCFPPVVINITDGEATDAEDHELLNAAEKIRSLSTSDGNVLLMNVYIGHDPNQQAVLYPASTAQLPDTPYARLLFDMSSQMPEIYRETIADITGRPDVEGCRGMSYNTPMADLAGLLNIGSISLNLLS